MFGSTRWNPFEEILNVQREMDRVFNQFWNDLPTRTASDAATGSFRVTTSEDEWQIDVPLPGVDPQYINLQVAGNALTIRVEEPRDEKDNTPGARYEQTLTVPAFLDLEKIAASHQHGMLRLTLPLKESVKPRRIQIETAASERKQLHASHAA